MEHNSTNKFEIETNKTKIHAEICEAGIANIRGELGVRFLFVSRTGEEIVTAILVLEDRDSDFVKLMKAAGILECDEDLYTGDFLGKQVILEVANNDGVKNIENIHSVNSLEYFPSNISEEQISNKGELIYGYIDIDEATIVDKNQASVVEYMRLSEMICQYNMRDFWGGRFTKGKYIAKGMSIESTEYPFCILKFHIKNEDDEVANLKILVANDRESNWAELFEDIYPLQNGKFSIHDILYKNVMVIVDPNDMEVVKGVIFN